MVGWIKYIYEYNYYDNNTDSSLPYNSMVNVSLKWEKIIIKLYDFDIDIMHKLSMYASQRVTWYRTKHSFSEKCNIPHLLFIFF